MKPIFIVITSTLIGAIIVASVVYHYQRETTSIEDKYTNRSSTEIDDTYHQSYLDHTLITEDTYYSDNIINSGETYGPEIPLHAGSEDDWDEDGWSNNKENEEGTQPDNPDTDGDGTIDSQDPEPINPEIGGTASPPPPPPPPSPDIGQLVIREFYKNVYNISQGETEWKNYTNAKPGDTLRFLIYIESENTSSSIKGADLYDFLPEELEYIENSSRIRINNGSLEHLYDGWFDGYHISVGAKESKTYEIYFKAIAQLDEPNRIISATNIAKLVVLDRAIIDPAFVGINSF